MIALVMFLTGSFSFILGYYSRNLLLVVFAAVLLLCCWMGWDRVPKFLRLIPMVLITAVGAVTLCRTGECIMSRHGFFLVALCGLTVLLLAVSLLPTHAKTEQAVEPAE